MNKALDEVGGEESRWMKDEGLDQFLVVNRESVTPAGRPPCEGLSAADHREAAYSNSELLSTRPIRTGLAPVARSRAETACRLCATNTPEGIEAAERPRSSSANNAPFVQRLSRMIPTITAQVVLRRTFLWTFQWKVC